MSAQSVVIPSRLSSFFHEQVAGLPRTYWVLWGGMLLNRLGNFVMPMLTFYLTQRRGLPLTAAGGIVAIYGLGSLGGALIGGALADRVGRRRTLLGTLVIGAMSMLVLGAAQTELQLALAAFTLGVTADGARPALQAAIADVVPPADRMRALGLFYWAINLGFAVGAVLAGVLAEVSFLLIFAGDAATTLAFAFIVWRSVPETRPVPDERSAGGPRGSVLTPFVDRHFAPFLIANFLLVLIFAQHQVVLPEALRHDGLSMKDYGSLIAINGAVIVVFQQLVAPAIRRRRRGRVLLWASLLVGGGFGLGALASGMATWTVSILVWTVGEILMTPVNASIVADLSPTALRGRYQAAHSISWSLGVMLAPVLGSQLAAWGSTDAVWVACAVLGVIAGGLHLALAPGRARRLGAAQASAAD